MKSGTAKRVLVGSVEHAQLKDEGWKEGHVRWIDSLAEYEVMMFTEKEQDETVDNEELIETLQDGTHRTNLKALIRRPEVREHFRKISEIVEKKKCQP
jgi:hypothetical protein